MNHVRVFALLMEDGLRASEDLGPWDGLDYFDLLRAMSSACEDLRLDLISQDQSNAPSMRTVLNVDQMRALGEQCAQVANVAMMIADNCGALIERNTRPGGSSE